MFKLAVILVCAAVCISPAVEGAAAGVEASASPTETINPAVMDLIGYQIGTPLLTPNNGPWTSLLGASLPPRMYIGQSNPVRKRTPHSDHFVGDSIIAMIAM